MDKNPHTTTEEWQQYQAVYVHIPFCVQKCLYCDFASYAGCSEAQKDAYTEALCKEIAMKSQVVQCSAVDAGNESVHKGNGCQNDITSGKTTLTLGSSVLPVAPHATIYFGGGTPSTLSVDNIERIVQVLKQHGYWREPAEATIEVNPGTADLEKLRALRRMGFDRISFGVQTLDNTELRSIGRIHTAEDAVTALALAREAGFARISADLIYGLPGQSLASLGKTLAKAGELELEHVSVYGLIVEEGTPLASLVEQGKLTLPDEDEAADMYELVQRTLRGQGFTRYEISNYAKAGQYSRHNDVYWRYLPYAAFGAAACGYDGHLRHTAVDTVPEYIRLVNAAAEQAGLAADSALKQTHTSMEESRDLKQAAGEKKAYPLAELYTIEELSVDEQVSEYMFMGLRRAAGADLAQAQERFGVDVWARYGQELQPFIEQGLLVYDEVNQRLTLTEKGMEVGNIIFEVFA